MKNLHDAKWALEALAQAARSDRLLIFVGSGLSAGYGLPTWNELAQMLHTTEPDFRDLPEVFSKYVSNQGPLAFVEFLERKLGRRPTTILEPTRLLLETRSVAIVTTNADRILETAASALGVPFKVFVEDSDLADFYTTPCLRFIKLHGTLDRKDSLVFTREQYSKQSERVPGIRRKVAELMGYCQVLFLGYSMADPDFFELMQLVSQGKPNQITQMVGLFSDAEINGDWRKLYLDEKVRMHAPLMEIPGELFGSTLSEGSTVFLRELRNLVSPRELPRLSRQCIIFTNGYTATLKTELTSYLSNCLAIPLLATHRYGLCTKDGILDPEKRSERYTQLLEDAARIVRKGGSVVLDGTFADPKWRKSIYAQAQATGARIIVIKTRCEDETYIRARLWRRVLDHSRSEHEVTNFRNFEITRKAIESCPIENDPELKDVPIEFITFDNHADRSVTIEKNASDDTKVLAELIRISPLMSIGI